MLVQSIWFNPVKLRYKRANSKLALDARKLQLVIDQSFSVPKCVRLARILQSPVDRPGGIKNCIGRHSESKHHAVQRRGRE